MLVAILLDGFVEREKRKGARAVFHFECAAVKSWPAGSAAAVFVTCLEQLGVTDYRVSGPGTEDVFLRLSAEFNNDHTLHDDVTPLTNVSSLQSEKGVELAKGRRISLGAQTWVLF